MMFQGGWLEGWVHQLRGYDDLDKAATGRLRADRPSEAYQLDYASGPRPPLFESGLLSWTFTRQTAKVEG